VFPQVFGKYVLERELGRGGMARVFLATLRGAGGFEKRLVVKQIRPELASDDDFVQRFVAEAKTAVSLSHPNIVPVYELGVEQGTYFIAMELCEGVTLAELLQRRVLSAMEGAYVGVELCRALDYAHRQSVVHRDITPRNVLVDAEGAIRLIDFGIAGSVTLAGQERQVFGSLGHMAPEHLRGGEVGPKSDLFSVGTVLIEAWTGRAPFRRETLEETQAALLEPPPALSLSNLELAAKRGGHRRGQSTRRCRGSGATAASLSQDGRHRRRGSPFGEDGHADARRAGFTSAACRSGRSRSAGHHH
jgi:serine/threonine-protein kinase